MNLPGNPKWLIAAAVLTLSLLGGGIYLAVADRERPSLAEQDAGIEVKRVTSGSKIDIDYQPENTVVYAGIRTPFKDEPLHQEAKAFNEKLVQGKKVRLRFDEQKKEKDGDWLAYVFVDGEMVNQRLVWEGLAYVRLRAGEHRFAQELLAAQQEARRAGRGLWATPIRDTETSYPGDRKHAAFHRPSCEDVKNTRPENAVTFRSKDEAFAAGFAPCGRCKP